jgi:outer membrane protein insertion porin family
VDLDSYSLQTMGASLRFGVPFTENDTVFFGVGVDRTTIVPGTLLPTAYTDFADQFGYTSNAVPLTVGWARDTRDSGLVPSSGRMMRVSGEWSVAGELLYARATTQVQQYFPLTKKVTLALNSELSMGAATTDKPYPLFKNYYSGGLGSVRGFEQGSLTTAYQRAQSAVATGGAKKLTFNAEVLSPLPGGGNDRTLRMYAFADAGGIYGSDEAIALGDMRSSFGVGISWISPVGPLRLAVARPISKFDGDKMQSLQFQIGTTF